MNLLMAEHTYFEADCRVGCHHLAESFVKNGHRVTYLSSVLSPLHLAHLLGKKRAETWKRFASLIKGGEFPFTRPSNKHSFFFFSLPPTAATRPSRNGCATTELDGS